MDFRDLVDRSSVSRSLTGRVQESGEVGERCEGLSGPKLSVGELDKSGRESGEFGEKCELFGRGLRLLPQISLLCVHEALDCSTCDPALSEWQPGLALVHVLVTQRRWLAVVAVEFVLTAGCTNWMLTHGSKGGQEDSHDSTEDMGKSTMWEGKGSIRELFQEQEVEAGEDDEERKTGEARHEHTLFAEVKRARDAVFDFGTHDCAFFAEVGSSVSSQGQQGSCSVPDVVDQESADFRNLPL
ncbi:hypothetical protein Scep_006781 [Stephania cephalantha]|uniref:Uncharacterized protein n=1 Tax=Stephania cephalantha TaxID=152367 RepID=A0AAP0KAJ7_9MAGN